MLASAGFWLAWSLMPGVGVTDTDTIFALIGQHRSAVFASVIVQLLSAAAYAPGVVGLLGTGLGRSSRLLRAGGVLLLLGAMGSAADAIFHLVAVEMTAPGIDRASMAIVMRRLQGPDLWLILPLVLAWFAGHVVVAIALRRRDALCRAALWLLAGLPVLAALGALARWADLIAGRAVGLAVLGAMAGSLLLVGWSLAKDGERA